MQNKWQLVSDGGCLKFMVPTAVPEDDGQVNAADSEGSSSMLGKYLDGGTLGPRIWSYLVS